MCMYIKSFIKVLVGKQQISNHGQNHIVEVFLVYLGPFEWGFIIGQVC